MTQENGQQIFNLARFGVNFRKRGESLYPGTMTKRSRPGRKPNWYKMVQDFRGHHLNYTLHREQWLEANQRVKFQLSYIKQPAINY